VLESTNVLIRQFFGSVLRVNQDSFEELRLKYIQDYELIVPGLTANHGIDALEYNRQVDDALPLEDLLKPDPRLRDHLLHNRDLLKSRSRQDSRRVPLPR
jgi:pyrimidine and pyridine-specific 5'-nucleotidase